MNEKITLQDLINLFSEKQGMNKKDAEAFVRTMIELIEEALTTEKYVKVKGFGTFKLTEVDSRESVNVNTGERIEIQGHTKVSFTPDATMKELINKPFSHFETVILNEGVELEDTPIEEPESMVQEEIIPETIVAAEKTAIEEVTTIIEEPVLEKPVIEEPIAEETPTIETEKPQETPVVVEPQPEIVETKEKSINRILWGIIVVLVLIILFGADWMFLRPANDSQAPSVQPVQEEVTIPAPIEEEVKPQEDTVKAVQFIELSAEELRNERVPSFADTLDYQIAGTQEEYTLQKGETIIRVSVKFFGTKKYWPYIVKHNMDILPDPDNIPAGVQLKIPKLVEKK